VAVAVVDLLEVVDVHHQDAERARLGLGPRGLAAQLREERLAREQARQLVVREQPVDVPLELAVDVVEEVEADEVLADEQLVAVLKQGVGDALAVDDGAVGRAEVADAETHLARGGVALGGDRGVEARGAGVVHAHVGLERAAQNDLVAL
jgi:hypothetical protein